MEEKIDSNKKTSNKINSVSQLCTEMVNDKKFNGVQTEQDFINYVNSLTSSRPELSEAVIKLKEEMGLT